MKKNLFGLFLVITTLNTHSQVSNVTIKADEIYAYKFGMALTMDVLIPHNPNKAAIVFMNSGGYVSGKIRFIKKNNGKTYEYLNKEELEIVPEGFKYPPLAQFSMDELLNKGFTIFDIRHGSSPKFTLDEIVDDYKRALQFLKFNADNYGIDSTKIGLFGASAGGYLATYLASTFEGIKAVAAFYPGGYDYIRLKNNSTEAFNNLAALHLDDELLKQLSIKEQLSKNSPSMLVVYGSEDFPFITQDCKDLELHLEKLGVESKFIEFERIGHEFRNKEGYHFEYGEKARLEMVSWFNQNLLN